MALQDIREFQFLRIGEDGLYDLFLTTNTGIDVPLDVFICERKHEMKMYMVSNDLYDTIEYTGLLCLLNGIYNPFSIREGDVLIWTERSFADQLINVPADQLGDARREAINNLFNVRKKPKPDKNRANFLNRGADPLPPNVLPTPVPQIVVENDKIKLTPNLFNNPKSNIADEPATPLTFDAAIPQQEEKIERVLVKRYIKNV